MPVVGMNYGETATPKVGGGYYVNSNPTRNNYYSYTPPKAAPKVVSKPVAKPVTTKPYVAPSPVPAQSIAAQPASVPAAQPASTVMDNGWSDIQNRINDAYNSQQQGQIDALKSQQQTAMDKLNDEQKNSDAGFYTQRNQADVTNAQNVQKMREIMAANGINASGENITASAGLAAQRQGAFNDINDKQNQANAAFGLQRNDIYNPQHAQDIINTITNSRNQSLMSAYENYLNRQQSGNQFDASQAMQKYIADMNAKYQAGQLGFSDGSEGGGAAGAAGTAGFNTNLAEANKRGLNAADDAALTWLVQHESGFDPNAKNPKSTAYGYGQFIKANQQYYSKKMGLNYSNPVDQLLMMEQYVKDRYGSAQNAVKYWQAHGNY